LAFDDAFVGITVAALGRVLFVPGSGGLFSRRNKLVLFVAARQPVRQPPACRVCTLPQGMWGGAPPEFVLGGVVNDGPGRDGWLCVGEWSDGAMSALAHGWS